MTQHDFGKTHDESPPMCARPDRDAPEFSCGNPMPCKLHGESLDLDAIEALLAKASSGPWIADGLNVHGVLGRDRYFIASGVPRPDCEAIAALRNAAPALLRIARAVQEFGAADRDWMRIGMMEDPAEQRRAYDRRGLALDALKAVASDLADALDGTLVTSSFKKEGE